MGGPIIGFGITVFIFGSATNLSRKSNVGASLGAAITVPQAGLTALPASNQGG